jgi:hypothetical protein
VENEVEVQLKKIKVRETERWFVANGIIHKPT